MAIKNTYDDDYGSNKRAREENTIRIYDKDGNTIDRVKVKAGVNYNKTPIYQKEDGTWTTDGLSIAKYTLNEDGAIELNAPKELFETPEFQQIFDKEKLKSYSAAYRTDPEYRVPYTKLNEDGTTEETQVTIPEFVDQLNDALKNFIDNYRIAKKNQKALVMKYGEKANNLSLTQLAQIQNSNANSDRVYLPDFIFNFDNAFNSLKDKVDENGTVSKDEFMGVYNLSKTSVEDLAAIMASIDGHVRASDWGEETVSFEDGSSMKNSNSAEQATRALALKNFILSKDPDAEWYQSLGVGAETLFWNAANGFTNVFSNTATFVEGVATFGQGHAIMNWTEQKNEAFSNWNEQRMLAQDATATIATLGQIGGIVLGTLAENFLFKAGLEGTSNALSSMSSAKKADILKTAGATELVKASAKDASLATISVAESAAAQALTAESLLGIAKATNDVSAGARFVLRASTIAEQVNWATNIYRTFMSKHSVLNWATSFLLDTVHDAIVYDAVTLRHVLEGSDDQNVKNYWLGQLSDNAKWWVGTGLARTTVKMAGKTAVGEALNARVTKKLSGALAKGGDIKKAIKDRIYGGDVIRYLENQIENLPEGSVKRNRLINQVNQERLNLTLRDARRALSNIDLEFEGLRLTDDSLENYHKATDNIRKVELAIDRYNQDVEFKRSEMINKVQDPSTGLWGYINPELGAANEAATAIYNKLASLTAKYNLKLANHSELGQDLIDYFVGSQDLKIKKAIAEAGGPDAAKAFADSQVIQANVDNLKLVLPEEITDFIDNSGAVKAYTDFYFRLNDYGIAKGVVDEEVIRSYQDNPIWKKNGYMPVQKEVNVNGRFVYEDGRYDALLENEIYHFSYNTAPGQHYVDPEMVRQRRISNMAKTEVNQDLFRAYRNIEDATNITIVSGEETPRAKALKQNKKNLEIAISGEAKGFTENFEIGGSPAKRHKPIENVYWGEAERTEVISTFSPTETTEILQQKKVLNNGNTKISNLVTPSNYEGWYDGQTQPVKNYLKQQYSTLSEAGNNYDSFKRAMEVGGDDFEAGLQRAYLAGDEKFAKSNLLNQAINNMVSGKDAFYDGVALASMKGSIKNVQGLNTDEFADSVYKSVKRATDEYVSNVLDTPSVKSALKSITDESENGAELAGKYEALKYLNGKGKKDLEKAIGAEVTKSIKLLKVTVADGELLAKQANLFAEDYIRNELNNAANALRTVNSSLVDSNDIYDEVKTLAKKIRGVESGRRDLDANSIMYLDEQGRRVYAEVDPNFASLYNFRYQMSRADAGALAKANAAMSKIFRFGTTTLNVTSMGNQAFKDTGRAITVGGAWNTVRTSADNMRDVFGDSVVDQIKRFDPSGYEMRQLKAYAEQTGQALEDAAISRELARGAAISPASTETTLYRNFMKKAYGNDSNGMLDNMKNKINGIVDKIDSITNGKRETYLRNRVYASNLNQALSLGYDLGQARTYAEFAMNNATTNFARSLYHLQAISDSTPYFQAAINGTKSFWRMWSLDPVGITGRIMGGLILPTIYLTGASLGDKENREVYEKIPEYQKSGNFVFVINKQVVTIPIPDELSMLVDPPRQFVEYLHNSNKNDFWELMMNDALGFSPVDLTAFSEIDMDQMTNDPTIGDRINRGFARVFSQVAPVPVKSAYMMVTGTDPYTGKKLNDPSYVYWDDTIGAPITMDYNQNAFAKWIAESYGKDANATLIEKVISGVVGTTGSNFLGQVATLFQKGAESAGGTLASDIMEQATKPYSIETYDTINSIWRRAVRSLTAEKDAITSSKEWKAIYSELQQTTDESKRKKLIASGQNLMNDFQKKVVTTAERLSSVYGDSLDKKKLGAVIQLLNFNSDPSYQSGTQYSSDLASDVYYEGKNMAIQTMQALGVTGSSDMSIFGYLVTDDSGKSVMKYSSPVAILDMNNKWFGASDIDTANIEAKLKTDEIKKSDMWDGYYAAKAKGSSSLKQYKADWNSKVAKALAPYITERGIESVLNNSSTVKVINDYMLFNNTSQTKAYLRKIFKNE